MAWKLYVANLDPTVARDELERLFVAHGAVRAEMIDPRKTSNSTGAALVEMDSEAHGNAAISALNGLQSHGAALVVGWADPGPADRMFGPMNIPHEDEARHTPAPWRGGFGRTRPQP